MNYDRADNSTFIYDPNRIAIGSKTNGKLFVQSYLMQFERKQNLFL